MMSPSPFMVSLSNHEPSITRPSTLLRANGCASSLRPSTLDTSVLNGYITLTRFDRGTYSRNIMNSKVSGAIPMRDVAYFAFTRPARPAVLSM